MKQRRFWPLFVTQFLGAFNDNIYKITVSVLVAYGLWVVDGWDPEVVVSLAAGLFILPFVLFAPLAGDLADKYDKAKLIRIIKIAEIFVVLSAVIAILVHSVILVLAVLFAFGAQSAFFSPAKFSILPQHLEENELVGGNGLLNTGTYLAILFGTILGGLIAVTPMGVHAVMGILLLCALIGYWSSLKIPPAPPPAPDLKLSFNPLGEAVRIIHYAYTRPHGVFPAILGMSWFYFFGATIIAQFPNFTKQIVDANHFVLTLFMIVFSVGIAIGGLLNNRILHSKIEAKFVPWAALAIAVFSLDLYFASNSFAKLPHGDELTRMREFISHFSGWRVLIDLLGISIAGGIYVVPLKSIVQHRTPADHRARLLAGSAMMDSLFILASSIIASVLLAAGYKVHDLFLMLSAVTFLIAFYVRRVDRDEGKP